MCFISKANTKIGKGSFCGTVGRAVAYDTRGPQF